MSDVLRSSKRPRSPGREFGEEPLLILNNFGAGAEGAGKEMELMSTMFKNLFPQIRVQSVSRQLLDFWSHYFDES